MLMFSEAHPDVDRLLQPLALKLVWLQFAADDP